ncbi:MAG: SCO family protein, partial [Phycisphaerales bacterium]|nr:SCO family protein [Phycisphaerales bacterium]
MATLVGVRAAGAQVLLDEPPAELRGVTVTEKLGQQLPTRLSFMNSEGETVALTDYFDGEKPVVLALVYFGCPVVCPLVLDRLTECFTGLDYTIGEDYNVVVVSIDHTEGVTESSTRKQRDLAVYGRGDAGSVPSGWGFHTGDETSIKMLADACGWDFKRLPNGEYAHPAAVMIASPDGVLTRYVYGFDYPVKQVKLSLLDASEGRIAASLGDHLMFYCYRYDPTAGTYSMEAMALMRLAGGATVAGLVVLIGGMLIVEKFRGKKPAVAA